MINKLLLKSEAVCMQPVTLETLTPTKYDDLPFTIPLSPSSARAHHAVANYCGTSTGPSYVPALNGV